MKDSQLTPADELRELLTEAEKLVVNIRGQASAAERLLEDLDRIAELWPQLEAAGVDLRPEAGRWETLQAVAHKQAAVIASELGHGRGLPALRTEIAARRGITPDALPWWWHLDRETHARTRRRVQRALVTALIVVVAVAGGLLLFRKLFPVDPGVAAASEHVIAGQQQADQGNYQQAVSEFQAATRALPNDPEPWLWLGVAQEQVGQEDAAQQSYARARSLAGGDLNFLLGRGSVRAELQLYDPARADLEAALKVDPQNAQAYYYLATVEESQGRVDAAIQALEKAAEIAQSDGQDQLVAMTRVRLGMLIQRAGVQSMQPGTPVPFSTPEAAP